ncbi:Mov34/MPN/PAD-1 family protein [Promineifilum sp.]|uniref:Mov34/MPN/PAD-1 family protein n=1 Tax=Promineifilum sp. TaxID=2664178 RepID=UPI0035B2B7FD
MTSASNSAKPQGNAAPENPAPPAATPPVAATPPDAAQVHREALSGLPFRALPAPPGGWRLHGDAPTEGQPTILVHQTALLQISAHSRSNLECELGGALLGQAYRHKSGVVVEIMAALPASSSDHGPVHFTFSADSWSKLHRDRAAHYPQMDIVGWFHTHPDLGVFYSSDDVVVHSAAFTQPWHVGLVVDPVRTEAAFFGWRDGALSALGGFYELNERQAESLAPWRVVRTAVWDSPYYPEPQTAAESPSQVVLARPGRPRFSARELGLAASALALLVSFFLIVGAVLPLQRRVNLLETTVLNLAQTSLAQSNVLTCPDPSLRILVPLTGQQYPVGGRIALIGTATYPAARRYQIDMRPQGSEQWALVDRLSRDTRLGQLAEWDTTGLPAGTYELRLTAVDLNNVRLTDSSICTVGLSLTD